MSEKILVCCHKKDICAAKEPYLPIHVGKALSDRNLGIIGDNTGDNISEKNPYYCELTGIYWAWKNLKGVDVVGLCHYRRYFDFHGKSKWGFPLVECYTSEFNLTELSIPDKIVSEIRNGAVVVPKKQVLSPLFIDYSLHHRSEDILKIRKILTDNFDIKYTHSFDKLIFRGNQLRPFNMFIMQWSEFNNYCMWLFQILSELEKVVDLSSYDQYQRRIFGFVAERLLNVYVDANNLPLIEKPIICFTDEKMYYKSSGNIVTYFIRCCMLNVFNYLSNHLKM